MVSGKISKTIELIRKLQYLLRRATLITIYKAFIRPHLDYGDILHDQAHMSFYQKLESIQYFTCLTTTRAIRSTSKEKFYQELGLVTPITTLVTPIPRKLGMFSKIFI